MRPRRIGLVINLNLHFFRSVLRGVKRYAATKPDWIFLPALATEAQVRGMRASRPAGVIAQVHSADLIGPLKACKCPVVNVSRFRQGVPFPRVGVDDAEVGRQIAEFLLQREFRHFGFVGHMQESYSVERVTGLKESLRRARIDHTFDVYDVPRELMLVSQWSPWTSEAKLQRWLSSLPLPVAIIAGNDYAALQLLEVCRIVELRVPEDVAVVGVDNDELLCDLARPSLTSVDLPAERVGFEAAALLDRLMSGEPPPAEPLLLHPLGVVCRRSSDMVAIEDPDIAAALQYIHAHSHVPFHVDDVLQGIPVARRSLERKFRKTLNRSVAEEIRRVHLQRAQYLLETTELTIEQVALHAGYSDWRQLYFAFRHDVGCTPSDYRRQRRGSG